MKMRIPQARLGTLLAVGTFGAVVSAGPAVAAPVSTPTEPPSTTDGTADEALFEEHFDDDSNGWGIIDHPDYGSTAYADGDYVWELTGRIGHLLPETLGIRHDRGELDMRDVVVRADVTILSGTGVVGVFCRDVPDTDADFQWYEFVARDGFAAIRLADMESNIEVLAETEDVALPIGEPISIEGECVDDAAGTAHLSLTINDEPVLEATDEEPLGNGVPGIEAWTYPMHELMEVRWHEFSVHPATSR
jgi:hypothetical protein